MKPEKFEHIGLMVADAEKSIWFYTEVIGMTLRERRPFGDVELVFLSLAGQELELIVGVDAEFSGRSRIDHFGFTVRDLDAAKARIVEMVPGTTFEDLELWDGMRCAFFSGPDGEKLELFERPA